MPTLPAGMFKRKDREGYFLRLFRDGRERYASLGTDFEVAKEKAEKLQREWAPLKRERVTVAQAADRWLATYVKTRRTEQGQGIAKQRMDAYVVPFMGTMLLERVTREDVREFRLWLERTTKLSVGSVWHVLSDCRCLLNWCEDAGLVERSPFPRRIMPRLQERPPDRVTDEEAEKLRALPEPYGFVCRLALGTGLRWGELCRAQARDVERGCLVVHHTKSGRLRRVPLAPALLAEVSQHVGRLVPFAEKSPGSFAKMAGRLAEIPGFHVHQMRHTFACQWVDGDGNLGALQQVLGHASIQTTQRYARMSDEVVMREAERIGGRIGTR